MKSYTILIILTLIIGVFLGGIWVGRAGIVLGLANKAVERQKVITKLTLDLAKKQEALEKQSQENQEIIRNVKDSCADATLPDAFARILR